MTGGTGSDTPNPNPGAVVRINDTTGAAVLAATPYGGVGLSGVAATSAGRLYAVSSVNPDSSHLIEIDPATGAMLHDIGALVDGSGNPCAVGDLSVQPGTDVLYGLAANNSDAGIRCGVGGSTGGYLMTINPATAHYSIIGRDPSLGNANGGIAFAPNGKLYFTPNWNRSGVLLTLDPATAAITSTVALPSGQGYQGLAVRSDGVIFGSGRSDTNQIYTINPTTGAETLVGDPGMFVHDMVFFSPQNIPAMGPAALALMVAALACVGLAVLRSVA